MVNLSWLKKPKKPGGGYIASELKKVETVVIILSYSNNANGCNPYSLVMMSRYMKVSKL